MTESVDRAGNGTPRPGRSDGLEQQAARFRVSKQRVVVSLFLFAAVAAVSALWGRRAFSSRGDEGARSRGHEIGAVIQAVETSPVVPPEPGRPSLKEKLERTKEKLLETNKKLDDLVADGKASSAAPPLAEPRERVKEKVGDLQGALSNVRRKISTMNGKDGDRSGK